MIKQKFHINSLQTVLLLAVIDIEARCTMWYDKIQSDNPITHKCKLTNINELCNLQSALMQRYPHAINNLEQYPNRHYTLNISFSRKKAAWSLLVQINCLQIWYPKQKGWVWLEILMATAVVTGDAAKPLGVLQS